MEGDLCGKYATEPVCPACALHARDSRAGLLISRSRVRLPKKRTKARVGGLRGNARVDAAGAGLAARKSAQEAHEVQDTQLHSDLRTPCHPARSTTKMLPKSCSVACGVVSRLRYYHDAGGLYSASPRGIWNPILFAGIVLFGRCCVAFKMLGPRKICGCISPPFALLLLSGY